MEVEHLLARERFSRKRDAWWVEEAPTTIQELVALERQTRHHPNLGSRGSKKLEEMRYKVVMNGTQIDIKVVCKIKSASKEFINSKEALGDKNKGFHSCFPAEVRMQAVKKFANMAADWVATRYKNGMINLNWMKVLPSFSSPHFG
ncbi:hypothetical protein GOBAR_AA07483 [Gossypium barbadense]|uniref:Uncharacterized protein n=1 Tax=Gossypium barbadense TaxID=3634 RepID=A0A2P5YC31_GOSBA|nr:hypothetical protein GOBAR_AA07483 [Gossypium barbadense]